MSLLKKYTIPGPRYTSYPTVPYWEGTPPGTENWISLIQNRQQNSADKGISIYIHLPYCEKLCAFCGCNTRITVNHAVEDPYIRALLLEWEKYKAFLHPDTKIKELHLGGGTPTFFSPEHLTQLIRGLTDGFPFAEEAEIGFEGHPNNTQLNHLEALRKLGFNRVSFGIQDFDPKVQMLIRRVQTFERVKEIVEQARELGYVSVNFDLIYGLPAQTDRTVEETMAKTIELKPDRLAYYSYAHIPWMKPAQRLYEKYLPDEEEKFRLYQHGRSILEENGYNEVGMDHFALPGDKLYQSALNGKLHRNFMGYNATAAPVQIGLGVSSISDTWTGFAQNLKTVEEYLAAVEKPGFPFFRGHRLTEEDIVIRRHILNLMCRFETNWAYEPTSTYWNEVIKRLQPFAEDGLIDLGIDCIRVRDEGKPMLRNICMALDARMWRNEPETKLFSSTV